MTLPLPPQDKLLHFIGGAGIAILFGILGYPLVGLGVAAIVGVGKEVYDYFYPKTHTADVWDFVATALGGLVGYLARVMG